MFAQGVELHRSLDYLAGAAVGAAAALGLEHREQLGVTFVAGCGIDERAQVATRSVRRGEGVELHAESSEHLRRILLEAA